MKILLVGEFSRLHNSLKEGLQSNGHEVVILGFNDGFKNFPVDYKLTKKWDSGILKKIKILVLLLTGFDISSFLTYIQFSMKIVFFVISTTKKKFYSTYFQTIKKYFYFLVVTII